MTDQSSSTPKQPADPQPVPQPSLPKPTAVDPGVKVRSTRDFPIPTAPESHVEVHSQEPAVESAVEGPSE